MKMAWSPLTAETETGKVTFLSVISFSMLALFEHSSQKNFQMTVLAHAHDGSQGAQGDLN